jgi:hypothetical protein
MDFNTNRIYAYIVRVCSVNMNALFYATNGAPPLTVILRWTVPPRRLFVYQAVARCTPLGWTAARRQLIIITDLQCTPTEFPIVRNADI